MPEHKLSHLDESGRARMVDVGHKPITERVAIAKGEVRMQLETLELIQQGALKKGDVLSVAQLAGVMAAKRTADLIPLCHPLPLNQILVDVKPVPALTGVEITATVRTSAKTRNGGPYCCECCGSYGLRYGQSRRENHAN